MKVLSPCYELLVFTPRVALTVYWGPKAITEASSRDCIGEHGEELPFSARAHDRVSALCELQTILLAQLI